MTATWRWMLLFVLAWAIPLATPARADDTVALSKGQTVYVPAYSHIYIGDREHPFLLTITLSIRNTDSKHPITVTAADYHDTKGIRIRRYQEEPMVLAPFESMRYVVPQRDTTGGSGANFIVEWKAGKEVNPPIIEAIMIGAASQQGISFTSRGQAISRAN
ncbi:MAG: DUF3124 domain-containing protein [Thermodesulfobacteriota bacterium]